MAVVEQDFEAMMGRTAHVHETQLIIDVQAPPFGPVEGSYVDEIRSYGIKDDEDVQQPTEQPEEIPMFGPRPLGPPQNDLDGLGEGVTRRVRGEQGKGSWQTIGTVALVGFLLVGAIRSGIIPKSFYDWIPGIDNPEPEAQVTITEDTIVQRIASELEHRESYRIQDMSLSYRDEVISGLSGKLLGAFKDGASVTGQVHATVNLRGLTTGGIEPLGKKDKDAKPSEVANVAGEPLLIHLPKPQILEAHINSKKSDLDVDEGYLTRVINKLNPVSIFMDTSPGESEIRNLAEKGMIQAAKKNHILPNAKKGAAHDVAAIIVGLEKSMGVELSEADVHVVFDAQQPPKKKPETIKGNGEQQAQSKPKSTPAKNQRTNK